MSIISDSHIKPTQRFGYEVDLIETVKNNLDAFTVNPSHILMQEAPIGAGIVDILLGLTAREDVITERLRNEKARSIKLNGKRAVIISCLYENRPLKIQTISRRSGLSTKVVHDLIEELYRCGFCDKPSPTTYTLTEISRQFSQIISIEGKLTKWKDALRQAYRNRLFSTVSYVVLDEYSSRVAINHLEMFMLHRVGLAVANADTQSVRIIYKPRCAKPISPVFSVLASETLFESVNTKEDTSNEEWEYGVRYNIRASSRDIARV